MVDDAISASQAPEWKQRIDDALRTGNFQDSGLDENTIAVVRQIQAGTDRRTDPDLDNNIDDITYSEAPGMGAARYAVISALSRRGAAEGMDDISQLQEQRLETLMEAARSDVQGDPLQTWQETRLREDLRGAIKNGDRDGMEERVREVFDNNGLSIPIGMSAMLAPRRAASDEVDLAPSLDGGSGIASASSSDVLGNVGFASPPSNRVSVEFTTGDESWVDLGGGGGRIIMDDRIVVGGSSVDLAGNAGGTPEMDSFLRRIQERDRGNAAAPDADEGNNVNISFTERVGGTDSSRNADGDAMDKWQQKFLDQASQGVEGKDVPFTQRVGGDSGAGKAGDDWLDRMLGEDRGSSSDIGRK
jgi:hypothetical protein